MKKLNLLTLFFIALALIFGACGGDGQDQPANAKPENQAEDHGVIVAKAILATFDQAVAEVYELVKDQPETAAVKLQLMELYEKYSLKMGELNKKYLALKTEDIAIFGSANGYLGENRGKHVWAMNQKLDAIRYHYQKQEDQEMDKLVHQELIDLLDKAVER